MNFNTQTPWSRQFGLTCKLAKLWSVTSFILAFFVLLLPTGEVRAQESDEVLEIAVAGPMSGPRAELGLAMSRATQLAVDEINEAGGLNGRQVRVVTYDDKNEPKIATEVAGDISKNSKALFVLGHRTSGASIAAAPIYKEHKIPAISGSATADSLTQNNPWYFRVIYNNELQADFIANYINSILKYENVTLVSTDSVYGKSLAKAFHKSVERLPLKVAHEFKVEADDPDIDLTMAETVSELSLAPDSGMVFLAMNSVNAAHFVREMRNSGFNLPIFGADSINQKFPENFESDAVLKTSAGDFTDQILATTSMIWDVANEKAVTFRSDFRNKFGQSPDSSSALYYDAVNIAFEAIKKTGVTGQNLVEDRKKIRDHLASLDSQGKAFSGITGKIHFDDNGNALKAVSVGEFQSDEFISAPVQLESVLDPTKVPNFADKREKGAIIPFRNGYMHATQVVYTGVDVIEISNLDTATGNYVLDFYLWLRFRDGLDVEKIEFTNAVNDLKLQSPIWSRERNGMTILTYKVRGTFHGDFVFKEYPFDNQQINLEIRHRDRTRESLNFVADRLGMRLTDEGATLLKRITENDVFKTSPGWKITDAAIFQDLVKSASTLGETLFYKGETDINFSRLKLVVSISRNLSSYSTTILLPMAILIIIGLYLFFVPVEELPPRMSGGILLLVTASLLRTRLSNDLPNIGYLVAMDYIFFALQIIMLMNISTSVLSFWLWHNKRPVFASRANLIGAWLYPLPMIGVLLTIWYQLS